MHQTRQETTTKLPISRKGTKYIAVANQNKDNSVPVVVAVRDMLDLARTSKEVNEMIKQKLLKINGKLIYDLHESIKLFNLFQAGKVFRLSLLPTRKFTFEESSEKDGRLCKVVSKRLVKKGKVQYNLHDGSNIISSEKISIGDSLYLDLNGKLKKHIPLEKGKKVLVFSGKYMGSSGKIESIHEKKAILYLDGKEEPAEIEVSRFILL